MGWDHRLIQDQPVAQCPILEEAAQARHFTERLSGPFNTPAGWRKKEEGKKKKTAGFGARKRWEMSQRSREIFPFGFLTNNVTIW